MEGISLSAISDGMALAWPVLRDPAAWVFGVGGAILLAYMIAGLIKR